MSINCMQTTTNSSSSSSGITKLLQKVEFLWKSFELIYMRKTKDNSLLQLTISNYFAFSTQQNWKENKIIIFVEQNRKKLGKVTWQAYKDVSCYDQKLNKMLMAFANSFPFVFREKGGIKFMYCFMNTLRVDDVLWECWGWLWRYCFKIEQKKKYYFYLWLQLWRLCCLVLWYFILRFLLNIGTCMFLYTTQICHKLCGRFFYYFKEN